LDCGERAVRIVFAHQDDGPTKQNAIESIARKLSVNHETFQQWVHRAETAVAFNERALPLWSPARGSSWTVSGQLGFVQTQESPVWPAALDLRPGRHLQSDYELDLT
jgi:hypothetical protein